MLENEVKILVLKKHPDNNVLVATNSFWLKNELYYRYRL